VLVREWIPVSTSPKGRLALVAVREFGTRPFDEVTVGDLAAAAQVTTGALYHHFESKLGLYRFVRVDVERRLLDRMEGAGAAGPGGPSAVTAAMVVGLDFSVAQGFSRLLGDPAPDTGEDAVAELLTRLSRPAPALTGRVLAAAWRAALVAVDGGVPVDQAREVLRSLRTG
jgi:AcrR family transcriptional regulator